MEKKKQFVSKRQFNQAYYAALDLMPALIFVQDKNQQPIFLINLGLILRVSQLTQHSERLFIQMISIF